MMTSPLAVGPVSVFRVGQGAGLAPALQLLQPALVRVLGVHRVLALSLLLVLLDVVRELHVAHVEEALVGALGRHLRHHFGVVVSGGSGGEVGEGARVLGGGTSGIEVLVGVGLRGLVLSELR